VLILRTAATVVLITAGIGCSGSDAPPECTAPETTTSVEIVDFTYGPSCVQATNGDTLQISNADTTPHTYTVKGTGVDLDLEAESEGTLTLDGLVAGTTYAISCTYHPEMGAALKIV